MGEHLSLKVSAAEIGRNFGEWQSRAMVAPLVITHHGRDRLVLASMRDWESSRGEAPRDPDNHALSAARTSFKTIVEHIHECFIRFSSQMKIVAMNHKAEMYFGITSEDAVGRDIREMSGFMRDAIAWEYYEQVLRVTGETVQFTVESTIYEGALVAVSAFPMDRDVGVLFSSTAAQEDALRQRRRTVATRAAIAADPALSTFQLNARGGFISVDAKFAALCGFHADRLATMHLTEVLHPRDRAAVVRTITTTLGDGGESVQARLMTRYGATHLLRLNMSAIAEIPGAAEVVVVIAVDLGPVDITAEPPVPPSAHA